MERDDLVRDVYAHFGVAIYKAQVLEHGLANAMTYASKAAGRLSTLPDFDAFIESKFEKTLGALIADLKRHVQIDSTLESTLKAALTKRNWLAHHYFRERSEAFMSDEGCNDMISELEAATDLFDRADKALDVVSKPLAAKIGVTDDLIDAYVEAVTAKGGG